MLHAAGKCTKNYNARAQPLFCLLILLFSDVPVAVAVVVEAALLLVRTKNRVQHESPRFLNFPSDLTNPIG